MPTIECTIRREGNTVVGVKGERQYVFTPVPGFPKGFPTYSLCEITKQEDVDYLKGTKQFREYIAERSIAELNEFLNKKNPYAHVRIVKKMDGTGYLIMNIKDVNHPTYCGQDGVWRDRHEGAKAFISELEAFERIKEDVEEGEGEEEGKEEECAKDDRDAPPTPSKHVCEWCGRDCHNSAALASHKKSCPNRPKGV